MRARPTRSARGFTLVEVLVAMSLLSLVVLAMSSALRTMAQTEERVDARLARADQFRSAVAFLQSSLGRAVLRRAPQPAAVGAGTHLFVGEPQAMAWVGIMPARFGAGGRYFYRLAVEPVGSSQALVLRFAPWSPEAGFPDWARAEGRVLVGEVTGFGLQYEDMRQGPGSWVAAWVPGEGDNPQYRQENLPGRVRVAIASPAGPWPEVIIPIRVVPSNLRGSGGGFTIGGSSE